MEVERERSVAGEVFFRNGHIAFDWRSTASMAGGLGQSAEGGVVVYYFDLAEVFFGVLDRLQKWAVGVLCRQPRSRWGHAVQCQHLAWPSRTRNIIFNGSHLISQCWAETDTPFPMQ